MLKFGFHYTIAGFDVYFGEMLLAMSILILFGYFNMRGVKVVGTVQTILAATLAISVLILTVTALVSSKTSINNMDPIWGFDKTAAIEAAKTGGYKSVEAYTHSGTTAIIASILATLAIAPWAFVGFDTIPQAAEEFKFSYKKVSFIMIIAILFGAFVYIANNTITAAALKKWPDLIVNSEGTPWLLLTALKDYLVHLVKYLLVLQYQVQYLPVLWDSIWHHLDLCILCLEMDIYQKHLVKFTINIKLQLMQ